MVLVDQVSGFVRNFKSGIFSRHLKCNKCQTLYDGTTCLVVPVHYTFSDLDSISKSQQCQTVVTENCMF